VESIVARLRAEPMTRIVALGSSNTELAYHCEGRHNWFDWLEVGLRDQYGRVHQAINAGVSGETSREMLGRFERDVALHQPHVLIVTVGGNDCSPANDVSEDEFRGNLRELVGSARGLRECQPILQTYYSFDVEKMQEQPYPEPEQAVRFPGYMEVVREVAAREEVVLFDHLVRWERLRLAKPEIYRRLMRDTLHVNPRGNMVIGLEVLRRFGAKVAGETAGRCAEGLQVQRMLDELERQ